MKSTRKGREHNALKNMLKILVIFIGSISMIACVSESPADSGNVKPTKLSKSGEKAPKSVNEPANNLRIIIQNKSNDADNDDHREYDRDHHSERHRENDHNDTPDVSSLYLTVDHLEVKTSEGDWITLEQTFVKTSQMFQVNKNGKSDGGAWNVASGSYEKVRVYLSDDNFVTFESNPLVREQLTRKESITHSHRDSDSHHREDHFRDEHAVDYTHDSEYRNDHCDDVQESRTKKVKADFSVKAGELGPVEIADGFLTTLVVEVDIQDSVENKHRRTARYELDIDDVELIGNTMTVVKTERTPVTTKTGTSTKKTVADKTTQVKATQKTTGSTSVKGI